MLRLALAPLRFALRHRTAVAVAVLLSVLETYLHIRSFDVARPATPLDPPFAQSCVAPGTDTPLKTGARPPDADEPRESATLLMLARNSDLHGAVAAVRSLEAQWNRHFHYPILFLNDEPWAPDFVAALSREASGEATFDTIPAHMWSWPRDAAGRETPPRAAASASMARMAAAGLPYAGSEAYHHMCRFYSGFFAEHAALARFRWFWRVEPDVTFSCAVPYDPFRQMRLAHKRYGYTLALWEVGATAPSLFRAVDAFRRARRLGWPATWTAMVDASWAPLPLRWLLGSVPGLLHSRTRAGDAWNMCHFWSNFEIAELDFFREPAYRALFADLDARGGFFLERWGDAPVHSLAAALLLRPDELHHFSDIGYVHPPFQQCPPDGAGCRCQCDSFAREPQKVCLKSLRRAVDPA